MFEVDRKFAAWENELPEQFRWRQWYQLNLALGHLLTANSHPIADIRRCYLLNTWYLACRMNLHRACPPCAMRNRNTDTGGQART